MSEIALLKRIFGWSKVLSGVTTDLDLAEWLEEHQAPRAMADAVFRRAALPAELQFRAIPKATYHRSELLSQNAFERVLRIARTYARALAVFDDDDDEASSFLAEPHPLLNDRPPAEVALSEPGFREVEGLLRKLEL